MRERFGGDRRRRIFRPHQVSHCYKAATAALFFAKAGCVYYLARLHMPLGSPIISFDISAHEGDGWLPHDDLRRLRICRKDGLRWRISLIQVSPGSLIILEQWAASRSLRRKTSRSAQFFHKEWIASSQLNSRCGVQTTPSYTLTESNLMSFPVCSNDGSMGMPASVAADEILCEPKFKGVP